MTCYSVRFGEIACEIEAKPTVNGAAFVATAYVREKDDDVLRPVHNQGGARPIELVMGTELDVLNRMIVFLESNLGPLAGPPGPCEERRIPQVIGRRYDLEP